jgi:hypothetical protein
VDELVREDPRHAPCVVRCHIEPSGG